ncbi:hypothetical protein TrRE_jg11949, partial [Triparma retinervis]
MQKKLL